MTIRKLPEAELTSRDHDIFHGLPLWYSFDSSAGLHVPLRAVFRQHRHPGDRHVPDAARSPIASIRAASHHRVPPGADSLRSQHRRRGDVLLGVADSLPDYYHTVGTDLVRSSRDFSLDVILPSLERVFDKKTFLGDKLKHVIEPRAHVSSTSPASGSDFNRFIRFDDTDILANTNQLNLSLTNRLYAKRGDAVWRFSPGKSRSSATSIRPSAAPWCPASAMFSPARRAQRICISGGSPQQFPSGLDHADTPMPRPVDPMADGLRSSPASVVNSAFSVDYRWKKYYHVSGGNSEVHSNPILTPSANQPVGEK